MFHVRINFFLVLIVLVTAVLGCRYTGKPRVNKFDEVAIKLLNAIRTENMGQFLALLCPEMSADRDENNFIKCFKEVNHYPGSKIFFKRLVPVEEVTKSRNERRLKNLSPLSNTKEYILEFGDTQNMVWFHDFGEMGVLVIEM